MRTLGEAGRRPAAAAALLLMAAAAACGTTRGRPEQVAVASAPPSALAVPTHRQPSPLASVLLPPVLLPPVLPPTGLDTPPDQPAGLPFPPPPGDLRDLSVPPGHGAGISLTFDDGPSPTYTPMVLGLLARAHATATFCDIGQSALDQAKLVRAEVRGGFALCDHSRDHDLRMARRGPDYERGEVTDGLNDLELAAGRAPVRFYRQPGGFWDRAIVEAMYGAGLDPLRWTDDPRDWSRPGTVAIAQRVLLRLRPGAVVLLHDGGGDRSQTVQALAWLLPRLRAAGWTFTLPERRHLPPDEAAQPE